MPDISLTIPPDAFPTLKEIFGYPVLLPDESKRPPTNQEVMQRIKDYLSGCLIAHVRNSKTTQAVDDARAAIRAAPDLRIL